MKDDFEPLKIVTKVLVLNLITIYFIAPKLSKKISDKSVA